MTDYTISGTGHMPDGVEPLVGTWTIGIYSSNGVAFDATEGFWRGGEKDFATDLDGSLEVTLPETTDDYLYRAVFRSRARNPERRDAARFIITPTLFELTADRTWQDIIETPTDVPVTPSLVQQVLDAREDILNRLIIVPAGTTGFADKPDDTLWIEYV